MLYLVDRPSLGFVWFCVQDCVGVEFFERMPMERKSYFHYFVSKAQNRNELAPYC